MNMIAKSKAVLCVDCDVISDANLACPSCGSSALMSLARVLDRNPVCAAEALGIPTIEEWRTIALDESLPDDVRGEAQLMLDIMELRPYEFPFDEEVN